MIELELEDGGRGAANWMAQRNRQVDARNSGAAAAAHSAYGVAARTGQHFSAPTSSDVLTVGAGLVKRKTPPPEAPQAPPPLSHSSARDDINELRRQQAEFAKVQRYYDKKNGWMAIPALAPVGAVLALEAAEWQAARVLGRSVFDNPAGGPKDFPGVRASGRGGNSIWNDIGRRAHKIFEERANLKPGWDGELEVEGLDGQTLRPDMSTPARNPAAPKKRYQLELKPDTPSGRASGARQTKKYEEQTGNKARVIYYDPTEFL